MGLGPSNSMNELINFWPTLNVGCEQNTESVAFCVKVFLLFDMEKSVVIKLN